MLKEFTINLPPQAKERPRFTKFGTAYKSSKYREWMDNAVSQLNHQWFNEPINKTELITINMYGNNARLDADNGAGSVLDVLVKGGILTKDNVLAVPNLQISWARDKENPRIEVSIYY